MENGTDWETELESRRAQHIVKLQHLTKEQAIARLAGFLAAAEMMAEYNHYRREALSDLAAGLAVDPEATVQAIELTNQKCEASAVDPFALVAVSYKVSAQMSKKKMAVSGAAGKHAKDPKKADKVLVRECWDDWQKQPFNPDGTKKYTGKAAFATDMRDKFPNLKSQPVIERWCRAWERES